MRLLKKSPVRHGAELLDSGDLWVDIFHEVLMSVVPFGQQTLIGWLILDMKSSSAG